MSRESCLRDFRDLKLIGKGSFGRVYRCIRVSDGGECGGGALEGERQALARAKSVQHGA